MISPRSPKTLAPGIRWVCPLLLFVLFSGAATAESLVIVGAGRSGSWDTLIEIANGGATTATVQVGPTPEFQAICPPPCVLPTPILAPGQSVRLTPDDLSGFLHLDSGAAVVFVNGSVPEFAQSVTVRAHTVNTAVPTQSAEIPVVRLSTVLGMGSVPLVFPGAERTGGSHSNVLLADLTGSPQGVTVEAFDSSGTLVSTGTLLGSATETVPGGSTLYLVDVLARLGVSSLADGQIRITPVSGGVIWGWIGTVFPGTGVRIGLGRNP
jgi:hypothetical protein